jgi:hypothetical protein|tara:strand:- start:576 stop:1001 length:426 start_codon:yes stop_codon:yes gene_type:complete
MKVKISDYPDYNYWLDRLFGWNPKQKISVRIDKHDTWSMDHTLAPIIYPMLVQLKETQHGHPNGLTEQEWDAILDEMIWAFEQKCRDTWEDDYYGGYDEGRKNGSMVGSFEWIDHEGLKTHQERMSNGFMLFGKYYENLWD